MKTIAIIGSCDTKAREVAYMRGLLKSWSLEVIVIDVATGSGLSTEYDISRDTLVKNRGVSWEMLKNKSKGEKIAFMTEAVSDFVKKLYDQGKIQGILSVGGLQNTVMATAAMRTLPIGFPKVMATTVASGRKTFESVVGDKDIVVIPSICDFTGLNMVTKTIMENACACCAGMVNKAGVTLSKGKKPIVGVTLMGVTNNGACAAIDELEKHGIEALGFHATGTGGGIMEQMAADGLLDGILDFTTHEITQEYFKGGFSYGEDAKYRLVKGVQHKVPLVICPGGLDFIDFNTNEFPPHMDKRVYMYHNATTAHIKILPDEAKITVERICERINKIDYPVKLLLPTDGMRHNTRKGEELYCKEVDDILINGLKNIQNPNVKIIIIPGNMDTKEWGIQAAHYMLETVKSKKNECNIY